MATDTQAGVTESKNLHAWEAGGAASAEALTAWVSARLAAHESALAALLAVKGARTPREFAAALRQGDRAPEPGGSAGGNSELRGRGQGGARPGADGGAARGDGRERAEPESRSVRRAVGDQAGRRERGDEAFCGADAARLSACPAWTRTRPRATVCRRCTTRRRGCRSSSAATSRRAGRRLRPTPEELEGLPADYIARHPAQKDASGAGARDADHRSAGHDAGDDVCGERGAARADVSGLQHAGVSGEPADSCSICWRRGRRLRRFSDSAAGPTWRLPTR